MTRKSGVPGKTVRGLARRQGAWFRLEARAEREPQAQLKLLNSRPGEARKERARLLKLVPQPEADTTCQSVDTSSRVSTPGQPTVVPLKSSERPGRGTRTRRRAVRK